MSKRNQEEMEEFRRDLLQEAKEEEYYEKKMFSDEEFAIEQYSDKLNEAWELLTTVSYKLKQYGHELSPFELLEEV